MLTLLIASEVYASTETMLMPCCTIFSRPPYRPFTKTRTHLYVNTNVSNVGLYHSYRNEPTVLVQLPTIFSIRTILYNNIPIQIRNETNTLQTVHVLTCVISKLFPRSIKRHSDTYLTQALILTNMCMRYAVGTIKLHCISYNCMQYHLLSFN